ncbi:MAG TPA: hypothetical protein VFA04_12475 [Bryobacteraceae bacterium]|nr:hypothetical protein [Bryobacteraceae bacterium]
MRISTVLTTLRRWLRLGRDPRDPWARVRVPVRKGPKDRSGAVALREPD